MMSVARIIADYRRELAAVGEMVTVRRYTAATGSPRPKVEQSALGRVTGFNSDEVVGGIIQGDRKVILLADDLADGSVSLPLRKGDKLVIEGIENNIENPDHQTRKVAGVIVAIELVVRGV